MQLSSHKPHYLNIHLQLYAFHKPPATANPPVVFGIELPVSHYQWLKKCSMVMQHFLKWTKNAFLRIQFIFPFRRGNCCVKHFLLPEQPEEG